MTLTEYKTKETRSDARSRTKRNERPKTVVLCTDIVTISASISLSIALGNHHIPLPKMGGIHTQEFFIIGLVAATWIAAIWLKKGYEFHAHAHHISGARIVITSSLFVAGTFAIISAIFNIEFIHRYLLFSFVVGIVIMSVTRLLAAWIYRRTHRSQPSRILFVGRTEDILDVLGTDFEVRFPYHQVAAFSIMDPENQRLLPPVKECHVVSYVSNLDVAQTAKQFDCDTVWVASVTHFGHKNLRRLAWDLRSLNTNLYLEPMIEDVAETRLHQLAIGPRTVLSLDHPRIRDANGWLKRVFDVGFSVACLILAAPIMILTAIAIKFEDNGPVLYKSERIGRKGQPYYVWKFRSMCLNAEDRVQELIAQNGGTSLLFKMKDDPRVTRVGKFIRKYSIDELPQLFNTLNGSMSLVGPRPQVQREVDEYDNDMFMRLEVPPGITGLWQVSGRSNLSPELAQALDLYYVDNWSFGLDLRILLATIKAVLKPEGAY